jgi:aspartyl-tRNA(Asn)/glutamyl-tRNA(Gln) amidotransferase subunit A
MAMGSDTGGSIRGPAGYCGTIGLKPTYGLVSRRGVFPLSYTLDHCGPLSWTVEDSAIAMEVIAGFDPLDPASADVPVPDFRGKLGKGVQGMRLGVPRHWFVKADGVAAETVRAIDDAAQTLAKLGAVIEEIELPDYELYNACGRVIMFSEAYAIHEKDFQTRPQDFGLYTYLRMSMGAFVSATDLTQAMRLRRELAVAVNAKLKHCDALITASTLGPAPPFADVEPNSPPNFPIQTMPFDVTGNPAMSIPTGFSASGLPLSMQIIGRAFDEPTVLGIGAAFEAATNLQVRRPSFTVAKAA